jgi:hypothetical protein
VTDPPRDPVLDALPLCPRPETDDPPREPLKLPEERDPLTLLPPRDLLALDELRDPLALLPPRDLLALDELRDLLALLPPRDLLALDELRDLLALLRDPPPRDAPPPRDPPPPKPRPKAVPSISKQATITATNRIINVIFMNTSLCRFQNPAGTGYLSDLTREMRMESVASRS